jgi:hypothetical protein
VRPSWLRASAKASLPNGSRSPLGHACILPARTAVHFPQTMNQVLLAPQFGVGRAKLHEPDEPASSQARDVPAAPVPAPAAGGPQVTIKRRRVLEVPKSGSDVEQPPAGAAKAPKVYQVAQVMVVAPVAAAEPREEPLVVPAAQVEGAPLARPKPRRRRDPMRQPTLLQHVVFEPAPLRAAAATSIGSAALDAKQLREALAVLDAELQRVARCEEAARTLDMHLTQLRIGKFDR